MEAAGIEPEDTPTLSDAKAAQKAAKPQQNNVLAPAEQSPSKQSCAEVKHNPSISLQQKCVPSVYRNSGRMPEDLAKVIDAWDRLPEVIRKSVLAMVESAE